MVGEVYEGCICCGAVTKNTFLLPSPPLEQRAVFAKEWYDMAQAKRKEIVPPSHFSGFSSVPDMGGYTPAVCNGARGIGPQI